MTYAGWVRAADKSGDLGDPITKDPLSLNGPREALAAADPMSRGALLMVLPGGWRLRPVCTETADWPTPRAAGAARQRETPNTT